MIKRVIPVGALLMVLGLIYAFDLQQYLNLDALRDNRERLSALVAEQPFTSAALFVLVYAVTVALSIPGALILTLSGGFLFGTWLGGFLVVLGATIGASILFLIAKTALGEVFRAKVGPWLAKIEKGFEEDGISYLLVLRIVPIFPFWLVNLVPAFLGVGFGVFAITTFVGIMPGSFVYASVGNGLGAIFDAGGEPDLSVIFQPAVLGPLIGLAVLACVPIAYKRWRAKPDQAST